ncbi:MAG: hypothetical protein O3C57_02525 [Verrucomicrobia bacterium]|nr:hypothetical protein [Verrucomicrobiota bacterium]
MGVTITFWFVLALLLSGMPLPDAPPECFVVTAALRGHASLVGPFSKIDRVGKPQVVNAQLLTFWRFEQPWQERQPLTHRAFRPCYNKPGPALARQIQSPLTADLVYLLLKPCDAMARLALFFSARNTQQDTRMSTLP